MSNRVKILIIKIIFVSIVCQVNMFIGDKIKNKNNGEISNTLTVIYEQEKEIEAKDLPPLKFDELTEEDIKSNLTVK